MKTQKISQFNLKSILYLSLVGIILSFSAFSCETYAPLEIKIENKTGYDLTEIRIDEIKISSLKNGETSNYISTKDFEFAQVVYATVNQKFVKELSSYSQLPWCGNDEYYSSNHNKYTVKSGKHSFVISLYEGNGSEHLYFSKK